MLWFPTRLLSRTVLVRVRAEGDFAADDPWNGGRQARFTVDVYKMVPKVWGLDRVRDTRLLGKDRFCLSSGIDGQSRRLPESLVELWRTRRVATEELPRLLHALQPSLRRTSYFPALGHRRFEVGGIFFGLICLGAMIACLVVIPDDGTAARTIGTLGFGAMAFVLPIVFIASVRRLRGLRRREMEWIMAWRTRLAE